jgi:rod shape determining protein RodA
MKSWRHLDLQLVGIPLGLVAFSVTLLFAISRWQTAGVPASTPIRQAMYAALGLALMLFLTNFDYRLLRPFAYPLFGFVCFVLLVVLALGHASYGAQRWINVGLLPLQPSEPAKLLLVIALAKFLSDREAVIERFGTVLSSLVFVVVPLALVLLQPDLGTSAVFVAIWIGMAMMAGVRLSHFAILGAACAVILPIALAFLSHSSRFAYTTQRLTSFTDPNKDPLGAGYNVLHSLTAVGSGGLFGRWFASGTQSQLGFTPVEDKDFIFSVIAEQIGFVGVLVFLTILVVLLMRIARVSFMAGDSYGRLLATGILAMVMFQVFVNIGMNVGVMPVTGIPLPLISYGGSSLITTLASFGILQSILLRHRKLIFAPG